MKRNEWYWVIWWLVAFIVAALSLWAPQILPIRVEKLPIIMAAIICARNLATALGNPDEEKEEPRWNKFWIYWGILGLVTVFFSFVYNLQANLPLTLWLLATTIITAGGYIAYWRDIQEL